MPLQSIVDQAASGSVLTLPPCLYRETITIDRPLTLVGQAGTEIRGSDVWRDWTRAAGVWVSIQTVPEFDAHGVCREGTERCGWPEQVFLDEQPLLQVAAETRPGPGQFALNPQREVVLGDDPTDRVVEVTMRPYWIVPETDGVVLQGFRMQHAANDSQEGAITDNGHEVWIHNCELSDAHGAVVSLSGPGGIIDSDISRGGQLGIHKGGSLVQGNLVHDNNTEDFSTGWEAGGMKSTLSNMRIEGNEFYRNGGPGIWIDIRASDVSITNNRVYENETIGIYYEISSRGQITSNVVWANSLGRHTSWVNGAGILVHSSGNTEVAHNVVAWNSDGIGVVSQDRDDRPSDAFMNNFVHDNVIVQEDGEDTWALGWVEDWDGPLFDAASQNRGTGNQYWFPGPEGEWLRFGWMGGHFRMAEFNLTPGEEGGHYLADDAANSLLLGFGIPTEPPPFPRPPVEED